MIFDCFRIPISNSFFNTYFVVQLVLCLQKNIEKKYKQLSGIKKQFRFQKQYFDPQNVINIFFQIFFLLKNFLQWRSWTRTLDFVLEKLVFIIFLKTLDEIAVHFSSQDVLTSGFSISWLRGNKKTKSIDSSERATARRYEEKMASKPYETSLALPLFQTLSSPKRHS